MWDFFGNSKYTTLRVFFIRFAAWGEYSHSFAAFLNQEECYRLILNKGANHDLQDSNGNTVTHIMVVYNNMRMFDLAVECGASINMLNRYYNLLLCTRSIPIRTMYCYMVTLHGPDRY